ncbi:MAG: hypothetical protein PHV74_00455 [Dehalococcoidia bacterium]|nr:hypothetical protein [Dehalococcoidia bacterium]
MKVAVVLPIATVLSLILASILGFSCSSQDISENVRLVGANYYPWWNQAKWTEGITNTPSLGPYDSSDTVIIKQHLEWAAQAGIDFLSVEWAGQQGSPTDQVFRQLIGLENTKGIKFCIFYDAAINLSPTYEHVSVQNFDISFDGERTKGQKFLDDMAYISRYFDQPNYLRVDGKPVVFFYPVAGWCGDSLDDTLAKYGMLYDTYDIADVMGWLPDDVAQCEWNLWQKYFEAITGGVMHCEECMRDPQREEFFPTEIGNRIAEYRKGAVTHGMGFVPPVILGYDDRCNTPISRGAGETLRESWAIAIGNLDGNHNMVNVMTFNEWHEGSEIEPSREYGLKYIDLIGELTVRSE